MCWMTSALYVYCGDHYSRKVLELCVRAIDPACGLVTTGCWDAKTTSHTRILDFCPVCKKKGLDTEAHRKDNQLPYSFFKDPVEGPKTAIAEVTVRPLEEREQGKDKKIWLKSFGGSSANTSAESSAYASRRGSVDVEARRGSQASIQSTQSTLSAHSTSSNRSVPDILSPSRYSKGSKGAAWGMTPEELRKRATTLPLPNGSRPGSSATSTPCSARHSRTSSLDTIQKQRRQSPVTPRGRPTFRPVEYIATQRGARSSGEELSPTSQRASTNFASFSRNLVRDQLKSNSQRDYNDVRQRTQQQQRRKQQSMTRQEQEEEQRLLCHPDRPSLVLAREEVRKTHGQLNIPPDVLEHLALRAERLSLESEERVASSRSSSAGRRVEELKEERPLNIPPDVRWHMEGLAEKLRRESDEGLRLEFDGRALSLRGGCMSKEYLEGWEDTEDMEEMDDMKLAVGMAQKNMRKDSGICMDLDELREDREDISASLVQRRIAR